MSRNKRSAVSGQKSAVSGQWSAISPDLCPLISVLWLLLTSVLCPLSSALAAVTPINVGSAPNDLTGERLRRAFQLVNTNFATLDAQFGTVSNLITIANVALLRAMPATNPTTGYVLLGYTNANDRGGGFFFSQPNATEDDDNGTIFTPNNNVGRIVRRMDDTDVLPEWFGGIVNNATVQAAIDYVSARGYGTVWVSGDYPIDPVNDRITMKSNVALVGAPGAGFHIASYQDQSWVLLTVPDGTTNSTIGNLLLRGRVEIPGSTNNTGYIISLGSVTNFTIGGILSRDWYSGYFTPLAGKSFENLQVFDDGWVKTVRGYGAIGDGIIRDTKAAQNAAHHNERFHGTVHFPQTPGGYAVSSIWTTNGAVRFTGDNTLIKQYYEATDGIHLLSGVFINTAHNTSFEGFHFTQTGTFPDSETNNMTGNSPPIINHLGTNVVIRNNTFDVGTGKGISSSGSWTKIINNLFVKCGVTFGSGQRSHWLFYQAPYPSSPEPIYRSALAPLIQGNTFVGSSPWKNVAHLSSTPGFAFVDNTLIDVNVPTGAVLIYVGDTGVSNTNGTNVYNYSGICARNTISGSFGANGAIVVRLDAPTNWVQTGFIVSNLTSGVVIERNTITGTGLGIELRKAPGTRVSNNDVRVTSSPLWFVGDCSQVIVDGGHYESTLAGLGSTVAFSEGFLTPTKFSNMILRNLRIVSSAGDEYALRNVEPIVLDGFTLDNIDFDFFGAAGTNDAPMILQLTKTLNFLNVINNRFHITNSMSGRRIASLLSTNTSDVTWAGNISDARDPAVLRRGASLSGRTVKVHRNDVGSLEVNHTRDLLVTENLLTGYTNSVIPLEIASTDHAGRHRQRHQQLRQRVLARCDHRRYQRRLFAEHRFRKFIERPRSVDARLAPGPEQLSAQLRRRRDLPHRLRHRHRYR